MAGNSTVTIDIPPAFRKVCREWYSGQCDKLYSIQSIGYTYTDVPLEILRYLRDLGCDVRSAARSAEKANHRDASRLRLFDRWIDNEMDRVRNQFSLPEDWEDLPIGLATRG